MAVHTPTIEKAFAFMTVGAPTIDEAIAYAKQTKAQRKKDHPGWPDSIADVLAAEVERLRGECALLKEHIRILGGQS